MGTTLDNNTESIQDQAVRLRKLVKSYQDAIDTGSSIVIGGDLNIDRHLPNDPLERSDLKVLYPILDDFINTNNLTQMNWEPTRHRSGNKSSLVDIFLSNSPNKIDGVEYVPNSLSEHEAIMISLFTDDIQVQPQFFSSCNFSDVNWNNLEPLINNSEKLNDMFHSRDPDVIASSIIEDTNRFIDILAPASRKQRTKHKNEGLSQEIRDFKKGLNEQITKSIQSKDPDDFRLGKNMKNTFRRMIYKDKKRKYKEGFMRNKWSTMREFENKEVVFPSRIKIGSKITASPKLIAAEFADHFFQKIRILRDEVDSGRDGSNPMYILKNTLTSHQSKVNAQSDNIHISSEFNFRKVAIKEVYDVILTAKKSKSTGHDRVSMKTINEMPQVMAIFVTHLFNSIIETKKFPEILKVTKIFPLKKPSKDSLNTSSYRPIANLCAVEKIIEELLKRQMDKFFLESGTIPNEHHGGRSKHSTATAKSMIDYYAGKIAENNKSTCLITTDLTAAYDTVDHGILIQKLQYHGFSSQAAELMTSFLKNRKYYVEVQGFRSKLINSMDVSVVQGSKLAGLLYTIYTAEIPLLDKIMYNPKLYKEMTGKNLPVFKYIEHNCLISITHRQYSTDT